MSFEGEILAGAAALVGVILSVRGVKIRIEHTLRHSTPATEQDEPNPKKEGTR